MTSIQGCRRFRRERLFITPFVTFSDFSSPLELDDKLSDQHARPLGIKPPIAVTLVATTNIPKYSEDDLQRIFKAVLEARAPTPTPVPAPALAPVISKTP